jgi:DNA-directed RNA polymerase specialized sigma24 family protein
VPEPTDAELLAAARSGQATAWNALVKRHTGRLWAIARSNGLDRDEAFDVVQATWLELFNSADRIRNPNAIAGWLNRVTSHEAIRRSKRARRTQPVEEVRMHETNEDEFTPEFFVARTSPSYDDTSRDSTTTVDGYSASFSPISRFSIEK